MPDRPPMNTPFQTLAHAQGEGLALSAWLGCAVADYLRRASADMACFARDKVLRDADMVRSTMTCRDPALLAGLSQAYLDATVAATAQEAGRQADKTARFCSHVLTRMGSDRSRGA
ncbi:hypothetical protein [Rhodovulum bhavnagarense]|nr:hypothetical protein [Rhodovulum bhavnagarense]